MCRVSYCAFNLLNTANVITVTVGVAVVDLNLHDPLFPHVKLSFVASDPTYSIQYRVDEVTVFPTLLVGSSP